MMKRAFCLAGVLTLNLVIAGCGSGDRPPAPDRSDLPPEVKEAEDKFDTDMAKRQAANEKRKADLEKRKSGGR